MSKTERGTTATRRENLAPPGDVAQPQAQNGSDESHQLAVTEQPQPQQTGLAVLSPEQVIHAREQARQQLLDARQQVGVEEQQQLEANRQRRDQINQQLQALGFSTDVEGGQEEQQQPVVRQKRKYTRRAEGEAGPRITSKPQGRGRRSGGVNITRLIIKQVFNQKYRKSGVKTQQITEEAIREGKKLGVEVTGKHVSSALQAGRRKKPEAAIIAKGDARDYTYFVNPKFQGTY